MHRNGIWRECYVWLRQHKKTCFILWNINTLIKSANMSSLVYCLCLAHTITFFHTQRLNLLVTCTHTVQAEGRHNSAGVWCMGSKLDPIKFYFHYHIYVRTMSYLKFVFTAYCMTNSNLKHSQHYKHTWHSFCLVHVTMEVHTSAASNTQPAWEPPLHSTRPKCGLAECQR